MLKHFKPFIFKYHECPLSFGRKFSDEKSLFTPKLSRSDKITSAIKLYVAKCNDSDKLIAHERKEFEFGRTYLAKMMGANPETFTQNDIDESIRYLFPSNLFNKEARPIMADPSVIYPRKKPLQCDQLGRPYETFYYTARPIYHRIMHDAVYVLENLKSIEDRYNRGILTSAKQASLYSTRWMTEDEFAAHCSEKIANYQFKNWLSLMNTIINHPYSSEAESFIAPMRLPIKNVDDSVDLPTPVVDLVTGQRTVESYGQKKWTMASAKVTMPGSGKFIINDCSLLDAVPRLGDRECLLFPLQFTDTIGKVDVVATCDIKGEGSLAYALRLAVSRSLSVLLPEVATRLQLAGLLTQDERYRERKQPGKPKARKSPPWRAR